MRKKRKLHPENQPVCCFSYQYIPADQSETGIGSVANDIALLKLNESVSRKDVLPICEEPHSKHAQLVAIGTGLNITYKSLESIVSKYLKGFTVYPDVLQEVQLKETGSCLNQSIGEYKK